ncbi:NEDD4-binding protein 2-like [Tribolium madens]|uniref:NEDD4-binding protein 2-like n=1 Tax=Tribolium madens TaxID=41895 RepID=UPI001CF75CCD|nr:NEDD4-binding protein 2-like [Tribolium madens]
MLKTSAMSSPRNPKHQEGVIKSLRDLFGNIFHVDIIRSVAHQCNFDIVRSSDILIEMSNNIVDQPAKKKPKPKKSPTHTPKKSEPTRVIKSKKSQELERVVNNIRQGYKVLVILRGLPGSGKSHLGVVITDVTLGPGNNSQHILSTDDYFIQNRKYVFDPSRLQEAHEWNHRRAFQAMSRGLSPVIVDNTNTQMWEMKPYAMMATDYGYMIEILEPDTWWCFNDKELARRNTHGVPRAKIKDMLDRYERNVTTQKLLCAYSLTYKFQKPPQFRLIPPIMRQNGYTVPRIQNGVTKSRSTPIFDRQNSIENGVEAINLMDFNDVSHETNQNNAIHTWDLNPIDAILMCTEENQTDVLQPKPATSANQENLFPDIENAWGIDEKALHSWDIVTPIPEVGNTVDTPSDQQAPKPETRDVCTSLEPNDWLNDSYKMVTAQNRDISVGTPVRVLPPPKKTMLDQSCMTDDIPEEITNEEVRIKDLMDLFPRVPKSSLRELFNKCNKNFHWTVDLLLEDNNLEGVETNEDDEDETPSVSNPEVPSVETEEPETSKVKLFKRKTISGDSLELKKCLESKFDINREFYSDHVYKVKQFKFGPHESQPSTSAVPDSDSDSESDDSTQDDPKNMIELNLGETFVNQLETLFGGDDGAFPKGYQPVVQMPLNLARQIYCFYIESLCQQMDAQTHILERLVKEDEELARKLQNQEESQVVPPREPNFMEIMDEQVAMSIHRRSVEEWKNMTADNLAAKLTKQKLFAAFPNIDQNALLEIWHAYDYDYNKTVEDLIANVGGSLDEKIKEPPISTTTLEEMKQAEENFVNFEQDEEQHPATYYRDEANKHLKRRVELYEKAKSYFQRGMFEVATFYSELAKKETKLYDKANHIAAAAFIEEHSKRLQKFDTLDLHYFYVKEAIPNLDIFIDRNINLLQGGSKKGIDLFVITGRGKNSEGGRCKIKPAVINRLKKRSIGFVQMNPGLLKIRVLRNSLVTSDLP